MHGRIPADPQSAIFPAANSGAEFLERRLSAKSGGEGGRRFGELARFLWPKKTSASLQYLTGEDERSCQRWAAGGGEPKASVLVTLLQGHDGERVLNQIMRGSKEPWWLEVQRARAVSKAYDAAAEQLSLLEP